jgi:hypothetical protein
VYIGRLCCSPDSSIVVSIAISMPATSSPTFLIRSSIGAAGSELAMSISSVLDRRARPAAACRQPDQARPVPTRRGYGP